MIYFILLFSLIALLSKQRNVLSCGLFGYMGLQPPDMNKIKLLGVLNESRGKHSCGIAIDDTILKGVSKTKEWTSFIQDTELPVPIQTTAIIGHTRHATLGAHTEENAHPFLVNNNLIGAHNGTIDNARELAHTYDVDVKGLIVDSHILYKIIEERGFDVLNDYVGYAALLFRFKSDLSKFYIYHGASRIIDNGPIYIERPLHYYSEKGGFYFSSELNPLKAIRDTMWLSDGQERVPKIVPHNQVICITRDVAQNKLTIDVVAEINRENKNIKAIQQVYYAPYRHNSTIPEKATAVSTSGAADSIYFTPADVTNYSAYLTWLNGRCHAFTKKMDGIFNISSDGRILKEKTQDTTVFYFFRGIMLNGHEAFNDLYRKERILKKLSHSSKFACVISNYSKYPVMVTPSDTTDVDKQEIWYWKGRRHLYLNYSPIFSLYTFDIYNGKTLERYANKTLNKGSITNVVFTQPEKEIVTTEQKDILVEFNTIFKTAQDVALTLSNEQIEFLFNYCKAVYFDDDKTPDDQITTFIFNTITTACTDCVSLRDVFEEKENPFEYYLSFLELNMKDGKPAETAIIIEEKSIHDLKQELTDKKDMEEENEETAAIEVFTDQIEDVIANVHALVVNAIELEDIDMAAATELSLLLNEHLSLLHTELYDFLSKYSQEEYAVELNKKFTKAFVS